MSYINCRCRKRRAKHFAPFTMDDAKRFIRTRYVFIRTSRFERRHLAMQYLELTNREHEYVALNRDTTESDLKQRREIIKGTATYFDQVFLSLMTVKFSKKF